MEDVKIPESVKKFMDTFCHENHEEVIYSYVINIRGNDELGLKPYDVYRFITAYSSTFFHIVDVNMAIDGETIKYANDNYLTDDMANAIIERIETFRQKVTA